MENSLVYFYKSRIFFLTDNKEKEPIVVVCIIMYFSFQEILYTKSLFAVLVRVGSNITTFTPLAYHVVIFHEYGNLF